MTQPISTTDNNQNTPYTLSDAKDIANLQKIANRNVDEIKNDEGSNILVFPTSWQQGISKRGKTESICTLSVNGENATLKTGNIMGFVGVTDKNGYSTELKITSRFEKHSNSENNTNDFFLHYMLSKVCNLNIVDLNLSGGISGYYDLLKFMFPLVLQNALSQGLYKEYQTKKYNDANVKGTIDVSRHIRFNTPFNGKIAYNTREFSYDNKITELVRHTIEFLKSTKGGNQILSSNDDTKLNVSRIVSATPLYKKSDMQKVLRDNASPLTHPFFVKYRDLQILCKMILNQNYSSFSTTKNQVHGILFDGAWLWEEYIAKVFAENKTDIIHKIRCDDLFADDNVSRNQGIIPDFIKYTVESKTSHTNASFIGDTKYKHIDTNGSYNREDYFQVLSYMFRYSSKVGCLIFPYDKDSSQQNVDNIYTRRRIVANSAQSTDAKSKIIELGMNIPQNAINYKNFCEKIKQSEQAIIDEVK